VANNPQTLPGSKHRVLGYAARSLPVLRLSRIFVAATAVLAGGVASLWCGTHILTLNRYYGLYTGSNCRVYDPAEVQRLGLNFEQTLGMAVFLFGITLVAAIQLIRQINIARSQRPPLRET
jgi:hypothetical protein